MKLPDNPPAVLIRPTPSRAIRTVVALIWTAAVIVLITADASSKIAASRGRRQRLLNWKLRRALALPYFFRSTTRESRVRKPATFKMPRRSGS